MIECMQIIIFNYYRIYAFTHLIIIIKITVEL